MDSADCVVSIGGRSLGGFERQCQMAVLETAADSKSELLLPGRSLPSHCPPQSREPVTYRSFPRAHTVGVAEIGLCLAVVVGLGACSSDNSAADITTPASPTITVAPPSDVTPTSTTVATTASEPATDDVEAAIRAAHTRVMTELFARDERVKGPEAMLELAEELTTGPLLERIRDAVEQRASTGERATSPGYDSNIVSLEVISPTSATVLDCSQDRSELFAPTGELLVPADDFYKLRESQLVLVNGDWLVQEIISGGDERCDPTD
jgi:hypothetical protein